MPTTKNNLVIGWLNFLTLKIRILGQTLLLNYVLILTLNALNVMLVLQHYIDQFKFWVLGAVH
jgi:hypothetical protein